MADNKPKPRDRKPYYIAPLVIALVVAVIILVTFFRAPKPPPPPAPQLVAAAKPVPAQPSKPLIAAVQPPLTLSRADLIDAARRAAAEFAGSGKLASGSDPLVGRRFAIGIPFACNGVQSGAAASQISIAYDAAHQSIALTAQPGSWTDLPLVQSLPNAADIEAVEGFWIPRPWTDSETCPPPIDYPVPATPTPATAQTLGLARIFAANDPRVQQRAERPYTFTRKVTVEDTELLSHSYRLVLEGTLSSFQDGHALHCWMEAPDHHPLCLFAVAFDHVAFVDGTSGQELANWTD